MATLSLRARRRHRPDRSRGLRFSRLGLMGCFGCGLSALAVAASQNPDLSLVVWSSPTTVATAALAPERLLQPGVTIDPVPMQTARQIFDQFVQQGYTLDRVREDTTAVPRVMAASLPRDLPQVESSDQRKAIFIKMLLPLLLAENERILQNRYHLEVLRARVAQSEALPREELGWLATLAQRYGTDSADFDELLRRVDAVPPSLAIAQAALETGWGTSRVAQKGNAMFGQMELRSGQEQPILAVKTFDDLAAAVTAYSHNLNTHRAYASFRSERAGFRGRGLAADGHELALHIARYSERGMDYVRDVRVIIRTNNLRPLENAKLEG